MNAVIGTVVAALAIATAASGQTLKGSHASVDLMYTSARSRALAFLQSPVDIYEAVRLGDLKLLGISRDVMLEQVAFPFVLPNTKRFVDSLAAAYHAGCGERLIVTSGARPTGQQPRNASPLSVHPTGMAVDFRKPTGKCLEWLRTNLLALEQRRVIEATEERHPPHFHVAVLDQEPERHSSQLASASAQRAAPGARVAAGDVAGRSGSAYRVRAGDNLSTIARRFGTNVDAIKTRNGLHTTRLRVGQQLTLP
jgi:hypothetical protein